MNLSNSEYRDKIREEIIETERTYVHQLQSLQNDFLINVKEEVKKSKSHRIVINELSMMINDILQVNQLLLSSLEDATETLPSNFKKIGPFMKPHYIKYANKYPAFLAASTSWRNYPTFLNWKSSLSLGIDDVLITPIQRLPRYNLLLQDLMKYTPIDHEEHSDLAEAIDKVKKINNDLNQELKLGENRQKVLSIQESLKKFKGVLLEAHRIFIKEGMIRITDKSDNRSRMIILFTDILLITSKPNRSNKLIVRYSIDIKDVKIDKREYSDTEFAILSASKSFAVIAANQEEKMEWVRAISKAIDEWKERRASRGESINWDHNEVAPVLTPEKNAPTCNSCSKSFNILRKRYHCCLCGNCYCTKCSTKISTEESIVRVCKDCSCKKRTTVDSNMINLSNPIMEAIKREMKNRNNFKSKDKSLSPLSIHKKTNLKILEQELSKHPRVDSQNKLLPGDS